MTLDQLLAQLGVALARDDTGAVASHLVPDPLPPTGTVYAVTTVRRKPADGGDYNVSLIDLDEGPRLMSRVEQLQPDAIHIGLRVRARVVVTEGQGRVVFDAIDGGAV